MKIDLIFLPHPAADYSPYFALVAMKESRRISYDSLSSFLSSLRLRGLGEREMHNLGYLAACGIGVRAESAV